MSRAPLAHVLMVGRYGNGDDDGDYGDDYDDDDYNGEDKVREYGYFYVGKGAEV